VWKRVVIPAAAGALVGGGFLWGYLAHRNYIFPYELIRRHVTSAAHFEQAAPLPVRSPGVNPDLLRSMPYVTSFADPNPSARGVTVAAASDRDGLNFYAVRTGAVLIDMRGREVARWRVPDTDVLHAELLPSGDVIANGKDGGPLKLHEEGQRLVKVDAHSRLQWTGPREHWHHDFAVAPGGDIYGLVKVRERRPAVSARMPLALDYIAVVSPAGALRERISLYDAVRDSSYRFLLPSVVDVTLGCEFATGDECELDLLHANHIEVFDGTVAGSPLYARGNILVSLRTINTIVILDGSTHKVLWAWGPGNLTQQHDPTLLANGDILIFNNGLERSEAVEMDPRTDGIVWRYAADGFFSRAHGSVQRLPGGDTLITESDSGRVFEVTPEGRTVWEFRNPSVDDTAKREIIWRMVRFRPADLPFLTAVN